MGVQARVPAGNPWDLITIHNVGSTNKSMRCTRRTGAHIEWTFRMFREEFGREIRVFQGTYNTTVRASAGTHDKDALLDTDFGGLAPLDFVEWMGKHGWFGWYRRCPEFCGNLHWHGGSLPPGGKIFPQQVGLFVDGGRSQGRSGYSSQLADWWNGAKGLRGGHTPGSDPDRGRQPSDKTRYIFDFDAYINGEGLDSMDEKERKQFAKEIAEALLEARLPADSDGGPRMRVGQALKQASKGPATTRKAFNAVKAALGR